MEFFPSYAMAGDNYNLSSLRRQIKLAKRRCKTPSKAYPGGRLKLLLSSLFCVTCAGGKGREGVTSPACTPAFPSCFLRFLPRTAAPAPASLRTPLPPFSGRRAGIPGRWAGDPRPPRPGEAGPAPHPRGTRSRCGSAQGRGREGAGAGELPGGDGPCAFPSPQAVRGRCGTEERARPRVS